MIINEMAIKRSQLIKQLDGLNLEFMKHIVKIYFYKDSNDYNHWLTELATWCMSLDDYLLKNNKRPEEKLFLDHLVTEVVSSGDLGFYAVSVRPTIDHDILMMKSNDFISKWRRLRSELAKMMSSKDIHSRSDYQNVIKKYM